MVMGWEVRAQISLIYSLRMEWHDSRGRFFFFSDARGRSDGR